MYPDANIWVIGHSLGGSLASLVGLTFGAPVVAFEAPAEMMAARRLHLPSPPSTQHITHVFNTADVRLRLYPIKFRVLTLSASQSLWVSAMALHRLVPRPVSLWNLDAIWVRSCDIIL